MNTNEAQEIEIPPDADWIDPLKAWKAGFRVGIGAVQKAIIEIDNHAEKIEAELAKIQERIKELEALFTEEEKK